MRLLLVLAILIAGCSAKQTSVENCVACGKPVSINATDCPNCGEPNPGPTRRDRIAKAKAYAEEQQGREEEQLLREIETAKYFVYAELLGKDLLTPDGQKVFETTDQEAQFLAMRALLDKWGDPFTIIGRKALEEDRRVFEKAFEDIYVAKMFADRKPLAAIAQVRNMVRNAPAAKRAREEANAVGEQ